jgi:4'-phosphopantetheinyl transferase
MDERLGLGPNEVHVWTMHLDLPEPAQRWAERVISGDEAARAGRLVRAPDRRRFVAAHGLLRFLVSRYMGVEPAMIQFEVSVRGKPRVSGCGWLQFNLSHSQGRAIVAVSASAEVGVDIEAVRELNDLGELARVCCSPAERTVLAKVPVARRLETFLVAWTRKEALLKLTGAGLSDGIDLLEVPMADRAGRGRIAVSAGRPQELACTVRTLRPGPGYVGTVIAAGRGRTVRCRSWRALVAELRRHGRAEGGMGSWEPIGSAANGSGA